MPLDLPRLSVDADYWSLRFVDQSTATYAVRKNVPLPLARSTDRGVMATVHAGGGYGYAATADLSPAACARRSGAPATGRSPPRRARCSTRGRCRAPLRRATTRRRRSTRPSPRRASGSTC